MWIHRTRVAFETFGLLRASGVLGGGVGLRSRINSRRGCLEDDDVHYGPEQLLSVIDRLLARSEKMLFWAMYNLRFTALFGYRHTSPCQIALLYLPYRRMPVVTYFTCSTGSSHEGFTIHCST